MVGLSSYKRIGVLTLLAALLIAALCPALAQQMTVYAAKDNAAVYDNKGNAVGALPLNTKLTLTGVNGGICRVELGGRTGYMDKVDLSAKPIGKAETPAVKSVSAWVKTDSATVYDHKGRPTGTLALNVQVTVTAAKGRICQIEYSGRTGYMAKADLSDAPVKTAEQTETKPEQSAGKAAWVNKDGATVYNRKGRAAGTLDKNAQVTVTASKGEICRIEYEGKTGYMAKDDLSETKPAAETAVVETPAAEKPVTDKPTTEKQSGLSTVTPAKGTAKEMDWWESDIQTIFSRGTIAQITDVETGLSWREQRRGGTNHADCQPLTAADTAAMKAAYGGTWSWNRRAIFVTIDGVNYAASMNGMPHGGGSITDNNFAGHHCIHFTNSRTHGSNKVCPLHQAAIKKAASVRLK